MRPSRALCSLLLCPLIGLTSGCSGLIKSMVNTQPRSTLTQADLAHPEHIVGGQALGYLPQDETPNAADPSIDPDIVRYAPVLIQGVQKVDTQHPLRYALSDDYLGSPFLSADGTRANINTDQPTLYWQIEQATIKGQPFKQLVYVFWYPRRPVGSIETGAIDGGILRITLDKQGRPAVYEYAQTCGCYHGVFVARNIEEQAKAQYATIEPNRMHAVEPPITGHDDWVVRNLIDAQPGTRPVLFLSAGKHFLVDIAAMNPKQIADLTHDQHKTYALATYDTLDAVPTADGRTGSIFNDKGLVKGARRSGEELMLSDLDHPGWPRRLSKMHIHWDKDEWTDPTLLATHLRLPDTLTNPQTDQQPAAVASTKADTRPLHVLTENDDPYRKSSFGLYAGSSGDDNRELLLFTDTRCSGCQLTKQILKNSPEIHQAIGDWRFKMIDTATEDGAKLAAQHRITMVPTLVGIDHNEELMRSNELESKRSILRAIRQIKHATKNS